MNSRSRMFRRAMSVFAAAMRRRKRSSDSRFRMPGIHAPKEQGGRRYALFNQTLNVFAEGSRARGCSKTLQELLFQPFRLFHPVHAFHFIWALFASFIPHPWICQKKCFLFAGRCFPFLLQMRGAAGFGTAFTPSRSAGTASSPGKAPWSSCRWPPADGRVPPLQS